MLKENIKIKGTVTAILSDKKGKLIKKYKTQNTVCTDGINWCFRRTPILRDDGLFTTTDIPAFICGMGIGTDDTTPSAADTDLIARASDDPYTTIDGTLTFPATNKFRVKSKFGMDSFDDTDDIIEAAIFVQTLSIITVHEPASNVLTVAGTNKICGVYHIFAVDDSAHTSFNMEKDTDWEYDGDDTRLEINVVGSYTGKTVIAYYATLDKADTSPPGQCLSRALFDDLIPKTDMNLLGLIWDYEFS